MEERWRRRSKCPCFSPRVVLRTDANELITALARRGRRILGATMRASTNGRPREIRFRRIAWPLSDDRIVSVAISEDGGELVLARRGGSKLSGDFSSVGHYRVTDVGIDDLGWSEDLPRPVLSLSPDGSRVAFHSSTAGSGGSLSRGLVGPALRHPPLPPHGETLGDRQAAEASVPKGKVTSAACSNEATYVFEAKRGLCFPAHDAAQVTELDLKGVETCRVLPSGDLVTVDKSGKIRRSGPRGAKVWEPKPAEASSSWPSPPTGALCTRACSSRLTPVPRWDRSKASPDCLSPRSFSKTCCS